MPPQPQNRRPRPSQPQPSKAPQPATPATILDTANRVGREVQATRADVRKLAPLLELLDESPSDGPSPIDELRDLLEAVLLNQRHLSAAVEDLRGRIDVIGFATAPRSALFAALRPRG